MIQLMHNSSRKILLLLAAGASRYERKRQGKRAGNSNRWWGRGCFFVALSPQTVRARGQGTFLLLQRRRRKERRGWLRIAARRGQPVRSLPIPGAGLLMNKGCQRPWAETRGSDGLLCGRGMWWRNRGRKEKWGTSGLPPGVGSQCAPCPSLAWVYS